MRKVRKKRTFQARAGSGSPMCIASKDARKRIAFCRRKRSRAALPPNRPTKAYATRLWDEVRGSCSRYLLEISVNSHFVNSAYAKWFGPRNFEKNINLKTFSVNGVRQALTISMVIPAHSGQPTFGITRERAVNWMRIGTKPLVREGDKSRLDRVLMAYSQK
jgi:hypothetical protein